MKKSKIWIVGVAVAVAVVLLGIIAVMIWYQLGQNSLPDEQNATENQQTIANVRDVLGKTISSAELVNLMYVSTESSVEDDFSKVYSEAVKVEVIALDEESKTVTLQISAPPLKEIFQDSMPTNLSQDYDTLFEAYMSKVLDGIEKCESKDMLTQTVQCSVVDDNGFKIVANKDLANAVFPDVQILLQELLLQMATRKDG